MTASVISADRCRNPFDDTGVRRGEDGIACYSELPLPRVLRSSVEHDPVRQATAET